MSHSLKLLQVDELPINPSLISKLKKANLLSYKKILCFSLPELQRLVKVSAYEATIIINAVSTAELKSNVTDTFTMLNDSKLCKEKLTLEFFRSCKNFEGIYTGTITEICGESGSGKTQLCLLLAISALLPQAYGGFASKVIYIHSEGEFPIKRFIELSKAFKLKNTVYKDLNLTDHLILKKVYNLKETMHVLQKGMPDLLQQKNAPRVIIIDSVAALVRSDYDSFNLRNLMIKQLAIELWKLANIHNMTVICVNQVTGSIQKDKSTSASTTTDIPALGLLWSNILTSRIKVSRKPSEESEGILRTFEIIYSSHHPRLVINFVITEAGIDALNEYLI